MSSPATLPARQPHRRRIWIIVVAGLLAVAVVVFALVRTGVFAPQLGATTTSTAEVKTMTVATAPYQVTVAGPGTLAAARTLAVTNATSGTIAQLASVGQRVAAGDVLAQLDPTPFERSVRDANLALQKAQAQLASLQASQADTAASLSKQVADAQAQVATQERAVQRATETLDLQQRLLTLGGASAADVQSARDAQDDARSALTDAQRTLKVAQDSQNLKVESAIQDLRGAELAVQQQQIAVEQAQEDLNSITTRAPFDGVVSSVATEVGAYVPADGTVLTLIDDRTLDLPAQIDETEIPRVKVGQAANVTLDAMSGQTFHGTVTAIAPTGSAISNIPVFEVTVTLDNADLALRPGMTAEADIVVRDVADAVTVPLSALQEAPAATAGTASRTTAADLRQVLVQQPDGSFAARAVELVDSVGYNGVVTGNLTSGDVIRLSSSASGSSTSTSTATSSQRTGNPTGIPGMGPGGGVPPGGMP